MQDASSTQPAAVQPTTAPMPGGTNNAEALQSMGFNHLVHNFDAVAWIVFLTLVVMSLLSWYYIIANLLRNSLIRSRAERVIAKFWDTRNAQESIREMEKQSKNEPFSKIALDAATAAMHHQRSDNRLVDNLSRSEFIDRVLRQSVSRESIRLESGLTLLATVGSAAVFVGLLGTVWGIYHALIKIGASGNADIGAVAGPVGEALIMTAIGLAVAIPAVVAYNFFVRMNRLTYARLDEFAHDLHDFFATGSRIGGVAPAPAAPAKK